MEGYYKALSDFSSIHWWISVVLVGILINLSSSGIQGFLGKFLAAVKSKSVAKSQREKRYFERHIRLYTASPLLMIMDGTIVIGFMLFGFAALIASFMWFFGNAAFLLNNPAGMEFLGKINLGHLVAWLGFTVLLAGLALASMNFAMKVLKPLAIARRQIESSLLVASPVVPQQEII